MDQRGPADTDPELARRTAAGDREAFSELYARHAGGVFKFARLMTGSTPLSEDVVQDVFLALMRQAHQFDPTRATLTTYLFSIARYHVRRHLLRQRRLVSLEDERLPEALEQAATASPFDDTLRRQTTDQVRRAVLSLPSRYREVVVLCDVEGLTYADAAASIGCAVGTVRSRLSRGRQLLADKLRRSDRRATGAATYLSTSMRCAV
jgi:RNA polymerase sigma-70 factor (ECF subfamily)